MAKQFGINYLSVVFWNLFPIIFLWGRKWNCLGILGKIIKYWAFFCHTIQVVGGARNICNTFFCRIITIRENYLWKTLWFKIKLCNYVEVKSSLPYNPLSFTSLSANLPSILYLPLSFVPLPYLPYLPVTFPSLSLP